MSHYQLTPPPAIDSKTSLLNNLGPGQSEMMDALRAKVRLIFEDGSLTGNPLAGEQEWAMSDPVAWRYLKSQKWNLDNAFRALINSLEWRREFRPTEITPEEIEREGANGKAFWNGFDRMGRPVLHVKYALLQSDDYDRFCKFFVYNFERGVRLCPPGVFKVTAIADVRGAGIWNALPYNVSAKMVDILQSHYPELLGYAILLNPSTFMWFMWGLVSPFLDAGTKEKVFFANSIDFGSSGGQTGEADTFQIQGRREEAGTGGWVKDLNSLVDISQVPQEMGGLGPEAYEHDSYWRKITDLLTRNSTNS